MTFLEFYEPLVKVIAFVGGWVAAMLTGLMFAVAR